MRTIHYISVVPVCVAIGFAQVSVADTMNGSVASDHEGVGAAALEARSASSAGAKQSRDSGRSRWIEESRANGFVEYSFTLGSLTGRLYGAVSYISSQALVTQGGVRFPSDSITTTSARFTIDSDNGWSASLFGDNLGDESRTASDNNGTARPPGLDILMVRNPPRTIGVQVAYQFGE